MSRIKAVKTYYLVEYWMDKGVIGHQLCEEHGWYQGVDPCAECAEEGKNDEREQEDD